MSKVIAAEHLAPFRRLELPEMGAGSRGGRLTVDDLQSVHKQAYEEGYAQGQREGYAAGKGQVVQEAQRLAALTAALARPLADMDDAAIGELAQLALALARHMVRRELKTDPGQIVAIIREAIASLPAATQDLRLELHPEDAKLVRQALSLDAAGAAGWQLVEVPTMTRGGCVVATDKSRIDATLEARFAALAAQLMGGEREHDQRSD